MLTTIKEDVKMKKNKKIIVICVIIIGIVIVGLCIGYYILDNKDKQKEADIRKVLEQELRLSDKIVEYGTEINLLNENKISNAEFESVDANYNIYLGDNKVTTYKFDELGEIQFTEANYEFYKNFLNQTKKIEVERVSTYTVEDTKKPIIEGVSNKEIIVGDNIDLKDGITARDEVDGNLDIVVEGEVDTNIAGEYNIKVIARDKNDNTTEETYIVKVNNKPEVKKEIKSNNSGNTNNSSKNPSKKNETNNSKNTSKETEQSTYNYQTNGDKIYFEEDRGENGNYSEKFTW